MLAQAPLTNAVIANLDDIADDRSSSLSELGDASDDQSEPTLQHTPAADLDQDSSEAETERLEKTPRKLTRAATDTSTLSELPYIRTPSKLAQAATIEQEDSAPPTPSVVTTDATVGEVAEADIPENPLHSLSLVAASEAASLTYTGRKRKRTSATRSPMSQPEDDEPAPKRSASVKAANGHADSAPESSAPVDAEEELENAEKRLLQLAQDDMDLEEAQADIAAETINEMATVAKHAKPRKGGRRGKRKAEDSSYAQSEPLVAAEVHDAEAEVEGEGEGDEEDSATIDEEVAKKKTAIDQLARIEQKFKVFREK